MSELIRVLVRCEGCHRVELFTGKTAAEAEESLARSEWAKGKQGTTYLCSECKRLREYR